jgi:hypothetical protein
MRRAHGTDRLVPSITGGKYLGLARQLVNADAQNGSYE